MSSEIIGITGLSGSGKTTLAKEVCYKNNEESVFISMDDFWKWACQFNCENPDDMEILAINELYEGLTKLKNGESAEFSIYDFKQREKLDREPKEYKPGKIIVIEGVLILWNEDVRSLIDLKVFIDIPEQICLDRRVERELKKYNKVKSDVERRWRGIVLPQWECHLDPLRKHADIITTNQQSTVDDIFQMLNKKRL